MANSGMTMSRIGGTVRLTMSAKVAYDLGALQRGLKSLAERLGCQNCATGCDILHIMMEREFTIGHDAALNVQPLSQHLQRSLPQDPDPIRPVTAVIPDKVNGNIKLLQGALEKIVGKLGCNSCCSGFDILFRREMDLIAFDENLGVTGFGRLR